MTDTLKVEIAGTATVPAKYAPYIKALITANPSLFQELADAWIADLRRHAANAGCEVDDVIKVALDEKAAE